jgi:hypothetical protein
MQLDIEADVDDLIAALAGGADCVGANLLNAAQAGLIAKASKRLEHRMRSRERNIRTGARKASAKEQRLIELSKPPPESVTLTELRLKRLERHRSFVQTALIRPKYIEKRVAPKIERKRKNWNTWQLAKHERLVQSELIWPDQVQEPD